MQTTVHNPIDHINNTNALPHDTRLFSSPTHDTNAPSDSPPNSTTQRNATLNFGEAPTAFTGASVQIVHTTRNILVHIASTKDCTRSLCGEGQGAKGGGKKDLGTIGVRGRIYPLSYAFLGGCRWACFSSKWVHEMGIRRFLSFRLALVLVAFCCCGIFLSSSCSTACSLH